MPKVLPTIPNDPPQGIQALLDKVYLWNPDVSNELINKVNELLAQLDAEFATIHPYSELVAPVMKYQACYYEDGVYVANKQLETVPAEFNPEDWTLIATRREGEYLPLSGGTMTGPIKFEGKFDTYTGRVKLFTFDISGGGYTNKASITASPGGDLYFNDMGLSYISSIMPNPYLPGTIGSSYFAWSNVYTTKISRGNAEITIPTVGGTLARIEDIDAIGGEGTVGQVLTKTADGMAWQDSTGGSGAVASVNGKTGEVTISAEDVPVTFAGEEETLQMAIDTLKTDQGDLGEQVGTIESKIPETASEANQLATKEDLGAYALVEDIEESVTTKELTVSTEEGTLNIGITAGTATIATNNGLDIVSPTKFDTAPTTDDSTAWADVNATALVTKAQVTTALSTAGGGTTVTIRNWA